MEVMTAPTAAARVQRRVAELRDRYPGPMYVFLSEFLTILRWHHHSYLNSLLLVFALPVLGRSPI